MTYFINLFFLGFKSFIVVIENYSLQGSLLGFLWLSSQLLFMIFIIKYLLKLPSKEPLDFHIIKYCFEYKIERLYSCFVGIIFFSLFFYLMMSFRVKNFSNNINLNELKLILINIYMSYPLIILFYNIFLFCLIIWLMILIFKCICIFLNKELVKLHLYYCDKKWYKTYHSTFSLKYSSHSLLTKNLMLSETFLLNYKILGYFKNPKNLTEDEFFKVLNTNYPTYLSFHSLNMFFYTLHYYFLLIFISYDIFFYHFVLDYTFKYLPVMLLYQLYITTSIFVLEKPLIGVCANANMFFYHKISYLSHKEMLVDGELYEIPDNFPSDFINYEASGFTKPE